MAVDLSLFVDSLKREVQPPGTEIFAGVSESAWVGYLADAFWEARLDGFLLDYSADEDGLVTHTAGGADIDRSAVALIILYAGIRVLRNRLMNINTQFRAKAGPVEYEVQNSANLLTDMLRALRAQKMRLINLLDNPEETVVMMLDAYSTRLYLPESYGGGPELTAG